MITSILLGLALGAALVTAGRFHMRNQLLIDERDQLRVDLAVSTLKNITLMAGHRRAVERTREFVLAHVDLILDNCALAAELDQAHARLGELLDENQLHRDDVADSPIPFSIVGGGNVVPMQRTAGDQS